MLRLNLEQDKLEKQRSSGASTHSGFDATKNIRLVPKFEEKEVDKYFLHFEKIAESLKWPKESWTLLLQSVFVGRAREIYSSLSIEQCQNYDAVKKAVLKAYELVPEAYRQKFRSAKKESNQTHVEFARVQEQITGFASHTKPGHLIEPKYVLILKIYRVLDKSDSFLIV